MQKILQLILISIGYHLFLIFATSSPNWLMSHSYNYRNTVKNYTHLPDSQIVQKFFSNLLKSNQHFDMEDLESMKSCFIVAEDYRQALLSVTLFFAPSLIVDYLSNAGKHQILFELNKKLSKFKLQGSPLQIFEHNAKEFGSQYPFYRQKILRLIDVEGSKVVFLRAKQSSTLWGVKIREWPKSYESMDAYNQIKRKEEKEQINQKEDTTYLLIGAQKDNFVIGVMYKDCEIITERGSQGIYNQSFANLKESYNNVKTIARLSSPEQNAQKAKNIASLQQKEQKKKMIGKNKEQIELKKWKMKDGQKKDGQKKNGQKKDEILEQLIENEKQQKSCCCSCNLI